MVVVGLVEGEAVAFAVDVPFGGRRYGGWRRGG
jgi:hypothetical protein